VRDRGAQYAQPGAEIWWIGVAKHAPKAPGRD